MRYLRGLGIEEGTNTYNDSEDFSMVDRACLILIAVSLIVVRILLRLKDLNKSVISLMELKRFSGWVGFSLGICSLGGTPRAFGDLCWRRAVIYAWCWGFNGSISS